MSRTTMTLEDLQKHWREIKVEPKSREELLNMTRGWNIHRIRKMRIQLVIECLFTVLFAFTVMGLSNLLAGSPWLTVLFVACCVSFVFTDFLAYLYLAVLTPGASIQKMLEKFYRRMKLLVNISNLTNISTVICAFLIFNQAPPLEEPNSMIWSFVVVLALTGAWVYSRKWSNITAQLKTDLDEFDKIEKESNG